MRSSRGRHALYRIFRFAYLKCVRQNHTPERIGRGMGLGVFIGIFPTLYFGPILSVAAAGLMGANRAAALVGILVSGPLTPFTWTLAVVIGNLLVSPEYRIGAHLMALENRAVIAERFFVTFLLGNIIVSLMGAMLSYALVWWMAVRWQRKAAVRRRVRVAQLAPDPGD